MTGAFLRNTGQQKGGDGLSRWTVQALVGSHAVTDERIRDPWWTPEEEEADPWLPFRRVHVGNLERCK